ncbi:hypothetical protein GW17_00040981 [Ensete ventricosum]|nr:hypothetical protein GW17_00040981 [Ensete ventricosum]
MEGDEEKSGDFYAVLGLKKECSMAELRNAYKKLAMKWHPDKCPASGNKIRMDKAKEKFQEIQKAYSGDGGLHWGDRANDESDQAQGKPLNLSAFTTRTDVFKLKRRSVDRRWAGERPRELGGAASAVRGDVPRRPVRRRSLLLGQPRGVVLRRKGRRRW